MVGNVDNHLPNNTRSHAGETQESPEVQYPNKFFELIDTLNKRLFGTIEICEGVMISFDVIGSKSRSSREVDQIVSKTTAAIETIAKVFNIDFKVISTDGDGIVGSFDTFANTNSQAQNLVIGLIAHYINEVLDPNTVQAVINYAPQPSTLKSANLVYMHPTNPFACKAYGKIEVGMSLVKSSVKSLSTEKNDDVPLFYLQSNQGISAWQGNQENSIIKGIFDSTIGPKLDKLISERRNGGQFYANAYVFGFIPESERPNELKTIARLDQAYKRAKTLHIEGLILSATASGSLFALRGGESRDEINGNYYSDLLKFCKTLALENGLSSVMTNGTATVSKLGPNQIPNVVHAGFSLNTGIKNNLRERLQAAPTISFGNGVPVPYSTHYRTDQVETITGSLLTLHPITVEALERSYQPKNTTEFLLLELSKLQGMDHLDLVVKAVNILRDTAHLTWDQRLMEAQAIILSGITDERMLDPTFSQEYSRRLSSFETDLASSSMLSEKNHLMYVMYICSKIDSLSSGLDVEIIKGIFDTFDVWPEDIQTAIDLAIKNEVLSQDSYRNIIGYFGSSNLIKRHMDSGSHPEENKVTINSTFILDQLSVRSDIDGGCNSLRYSPNFLKVVLEAMDRDTDTDENVYSKVSMHAERLSYRLKTRLDKYPRVSSFENTESFEESIRRLFISIHTLSTDNLNFDYGNVLSTLEHVAEHYLADLEPTDIECMHELASEFFYRIFPEEHSFTKRVGNVLDKVLSFDFHLKEQKDMVAAIRVPKPMAGQSIEQLLQTSLGLSGGKDIIGDAFGTIDDVIGELEKSWNPYTHAGTAIKTLKELNHLSRIVIDGRVLARMVRLESVIGETMYYYIARYNSNLPGHIFNVLNEGNAHASDDAKFSSDEIFANILEHQISYFVLTRNLDPVVGINYINNILFCFANNGGYQLNAELRNATIDRLLDLGLKLIEPSTSSLFMGFEDPMDTASSLASIQKNNNQIPVFRQQELIRHLIHTLVNTISEDETFKRLALNNGGDTKINSILLNLRQKYLKVASHRTTQTSGLDHELIEIEKCLRKRNIEFAE